MEPNRRICVGDTVSHQNIGPRTYYTVMERRTQGGVIVQYQSGPLSNMERHDVRRIWHAAEHFLTVVYPSAIQLPQGI